MKKENSAKVVIDETCLNIMKAKYDKTTANIIVNNEKLKTFPLKSALRLGCPYSSLVVLGILATPFKEEKDIKRILIGKEEVKLSICTWYYPLHRKPKRCHQKITGVNQWIE